MFHRSRPQISAEYRGMRGGDVAQTPMISNESGAIASSSEQPVGTYSSGMLLRLAFAFSITLRPELLIVDEAVAVGDTFFLQAMLSENQGIS